MEKEMVDGMITLQIKYEKLKIEAARLYADGYEQAQEKGFEKGKTEGFKVGYEEGYVAGQDDIEG